MPLASGVATSMTSNPLRKVVNMLQSMQTKVVEEGDKAEELFEKFKCYCTKSGGDLSSGIEAAEGKVAELGPSIEASVSKKEQLDKDLVAHKADRVSAGTAMDEASALRAKEKAAYDKALAENKANYDAMTKAVTALDKGMGGSFLQSRFAGVLRSYVSNSQAVEDTDRQSVLAFLTGAQAEGAEYSPASGEILGILKQMKDEMFKDQQDMIAEEESAVKAYEELTGAKKKEVAALSKAIEEKLSRVGELGVEIASMSNDLEDTSEQLAEDKAFLAQLEKSCSSSGSVHEEEKKARAEELLALSETIKILNDDDALDLFKKTLPSAAMSFIQVQRTSSTLRAQARSLLAQARSRQQPQQRQRLDFIALALHGRKAGFDEIVTLIDKMIVSLKVEQKDDDDKTKYCAAEMDSSDDKKKGLERSSEDIGVAIAEAKEGIETLTEEIKALKAGIIALDKSVVEATELRKAENTAYKQLMADNGAAKEIILFAKNRLAKFYAPALHKAASAASFVQLASKRGAPPPPPETAAAYTAKASESGGVLQMMDLLVSDLDREMTIAKAEEKNSQEEYEEMMSDSAEKRAMDSKGLTDKEASVAGMEASVESGVSEQKSTGKELKATEAYIMSLHAECDWLLQYYDTRKTARADEVDSLEKAKAVLSGADYSLLQVGARVGRARKFLRSGPLA